jgi:hypothetical protein
MAVSETASTHVPDELTRGREIIDGVALPRPLKFVPELEPLNRVAEDAAAFGAAVLRQKSTHGTRKREQQERIKASRPQPFLDSIANSE